MDWEKQDNELRKLMAGSDFLPDGEIWDARETWKKLERKNHPLKADRRIIWLRLATAACVVGLMGIGFLWFQRKSLLVNPVNSMVKTTEENGNQKGRNPELIDSDKNQVETQSTTQAIIPLTKNENNFSSNAIQLQNEKPSIQRNNKKEDEELSKAAIVSTNIESPENTIVINEVAENTNRGTLVDVTTTEAEMQTIAAVPAKLKKIKVIHYNELKGNRSTPPPGFAQIKKSQFEWESIAMQALSTPKEPSFQLKIELSPAPKKSL